MSTTDVSQMSRDQDLAAAAANGGTYPSSHATDMLEQQYNNLGMYDQHQQQQQFKTGAATLLNNTNMASYPQQQFSSTNTYPTASAAEAPFGLFDQQYQQQQQPLPEDAPAPKTDPVELSLLASYLEVVRQTQGDAAAAEAMAASGADAATLGNAISSSPSHTAAEASWSAGAAAAGGATAASTAAAEDNLAVNNLLGFIKQRKLTGLPQMPTSRRSSSGGASTSSSTTGAAGGSAQAQQATAAGGKKIWIQPSGPRRPGEGVENEEQGILSAEEVSATGEVMMRITLLAAGFVIGPSGASVREIVRVTGADVNSWTESAGTHRGRRPARIFVIKGDPSCVAQAIYIITAAVDRYKELCEGRYTGQSVPRSQNVLGVTFSYQPPPKSIVPCAASLKELYAPVNSVAAQAEFGNISPPDLFGAARLANPRLRGPPNPYDPAAWTAMMTAAAQMGMNPFAALAAAGGNPAAAAALGYNPYSAAFGGFNPAAAGGFGVMGGFGGPQNPMGGLGAGGLEHMGAGLGGLGFGMGHLLNPATSAGLLGNTGDMFGGGGGLFGGGLSMEGSHNPNDPAAAAAAGYGGGWGAALGPSMFDPTGMSALMSTGLFAMPGNAAVARGIDPAAAGGYDQMAAMAAAAAAGMNPNAALGTEGSGNFPFCHLLQGPSSTGGAAAAHIDSAAAAAVAADSSTPTDISGNRRLNRANSSGSSRGPVAAAGMASKSNSGDHQNTASGDPSSTAAAMAAATGRPSGLPGPGWHQSGSGAHTAAAAAHGQNIRSRAQLPPLQLPSDDDPGHNAAAAAGDSSTTPKSPAVRAGHAGHGVMHPPPPHSPHMLGHFGPLFHPISPAVPMIPYGPLPGMPPYAAPSPIRVMRDRSGQPVPYMEVGGTTYFPVSPMPPPIPMVHHGLFSPTAHRAPRSSDHHIDQPDTTPRHSDPRQGQSGTAGDAAAAAGSSGEGSSGGSVGRRGGRGRPPSGQTPLRMAGSALRLLEDNPYLVQDTIGSNKSPEGQQQHQGSYHSSGSSMGSSASGGRQYMRGGARGSPRRGYAAASPRQQQWQPRRNAGSSNSVGSTGIAAAGSDRINDGHHHAPGGAGPGFDAAAINAALALPGSSNGSDAAVRDVRDTPTKARYNSQQYKDNNSYDHSDRGIRASDQMAADLAGTTTCMRPSLSAIPESSIAPERSPPSVGISSSSRYSSGGRPGGYSQLGAQDPIVSPGRITLASKVKAARFSAAAAHAAVSGRTSPGSE